MHLESGKIPRSMARKNPWNQKEAGKGDGTGPATPLPA